VVDVRDDAKIADVFHARLFVKKIRSAKVEIIGRITGRIPLPNDVFIQFKRITLPGYPGELFRQGD
jgi:hypothetical protein